MWRGRAPGCLQRRLEGLGRPGGDPGIVGVLKQLGGIPPSSLGARGRKTTGGGAAGPAGGPSPGRQVSFSIFPVCLIFPFFNYFSIICVAY